MDPVSFLAWRFWYFFRNPARHAPAGRNVVSPADGKVLYVREFGPGELPAPTKAGIVLPIDDWPEAARASEGGALIGIYMTPVSVHYNRAPIAGRIATVVARPAKKENLSMVRAFIRLAWDMRPFEEDGRYILENARNTVVIAGDFPVVVVQMADRFVDQVDCFVAVGQQIEKGERIGLIRMGSQCDLFIPRGAGVKLACRAGDRVRAGESILATY